MDGSRHGNRVDALLGHRAVSFCFQRIDGRIHGCPAAAVDRPDTLFLVVPYQSEHVAAHAGGYRLHHVEHRGAGDGGVHGVAPFHQDAYTGHRR